MTTFGVTMVKNERDVIEYTLRHMATQVDHIIVADNMSDDGTGSIISELIDEGLPITCQVDEEVGYYQSRKMTALANQAYRQGAKWIVPFDADEIWVGRRYSDSRPSRLAQFLHDMGRIFPTSHYVHARIANHYATGLDDMGDPNPFTRMRHCKPGDPKFYKVAIRWRSDLVIEQGNHGVHSDKGRPLRPVPYDITMHHFPYRSAEQFVAKAKQGAAAYAATDLPADMGNHWRSYGAMSEEAALAWYLQWFYYPEPGSQGLTLDPAPYQG